MPFPARNWEMSVFGPALLTYIICWYNSAKSCVHAIFTGTSSSGMPRTTLGCSCNDIVSHVYCGLELVSPHPVEDPGQQATQTWGISAPVRQMEIPLEWFTLPLYITLKFTCLLSIYQGWRENSPYKQSRIVFEMCSTAIQEEREGGSHRYSFPVLISYLDKDF